MRNARLPSVPCRRGAASLALVVLALAFAAAADARTRTFCGVVKRSCGGHLQPVCTSGAACDAGHRQYSGSPFPITINCPWPIADVRVTAGCYDERPDCGDCSAQGQIPCPVEAEPWCTAGCDAGLEPDPIAGLCQEPGSFELPKAGANESCAPGLVACDEGLQCTLALLCSHEPAREGETCDVGAPCGDGLFCAAGVPQVCKRERTVGQGCSVLNPCADGLSCEACFTERCRAPFQCFPNANGGILSEQQCRTLYSRELSDAAADLGLAMTYGAGDGAALGVGESQSIGVAYGANGEYGCWTNLCAGAGVVASLSASVSVGFYDDYAYLDGDTFAVVEEAGAVVSFATSQVFQLGDDLLPFGPVIGTEDALSIGVGIPLAAGAYVCTGTLDTLTVEPGENDPPPSPLPALEMIVNPDFDADLAAWQCSAGAQCAWVADAPAGFGAGRVRSPLAGAQAGRLASSCVSVQEGLPYRGAAWARATGARDGVLALHWSTTDACGDVAATDVLGSAPADGTWRRVAAVTTAPAGARTVRLVAEALRDDTGAASEMRIDAAYVPEPHAALAGLAALVSLACAGRRRRPAGMMRPGEDAGLRRSRGVPHGPARRAARDR